MTEVNIANLQLHFANLTIHRTHAHCTSYQIAFRMHIEACDRTSQLAKVRPNIASHALVLTLTFLGYIGDKIGFKIVLAVTLFSAGLSATAFDWTPRFNEYYRIPTLSLMENNQSQK
jgi:hypothetical protein